MRPVLDEVQQEHIFICLKEGEKAFLKARKSSESLGLSTKAIDDVLEVNKELRHMFNPRAEEEARENSRRKDPTQIDIEEVASSGETGGRGKRDNNPIAGSITPKETAKSVEIPPTDTVLRDNLIACGLYVMITDIKALTSSDRDRVIAFAREFDRFKTEGNPPIPDAIDAASIYEERLDFLERIGPYKVRGFPENVDVPTSTFVYLPGAPGESELIEGEYVDGQDAQIRCAMLNRTLLRGTPIESDVVEAWANAGPWQLIAKETPSGESDEIVVRWYVVNEIEGVQERVYADTGAAIAARYNRFEAGRDEAGEWKTPPERKLALVTEENNEGDRPSEDGGTVTEGETQAAASAPVAE